MHTSGNNTHAAFITNTTKARWYLCALALGLGLVIQAHAVSGNVDPYYIEVDEGASGANLYLDTTAPLMIDWVKDALPNTDPPTLVDGVAVGITNGTGMVGGTGHWNGVRIVDGIANADTDIFLTGGKENDTTSWNVGPGSVGSSKYDITQAYLANNKEYLYFGMERRGNNGTTAFDFEFNQLPPLSTYLPNRTNGDVLFTFEMSGSGNSGSAQPYFFIWNGERYLPADNKTTSLRSSINQASTPAAPWGRVDSHGDWVGTALERFEFAEASVLLTEAFTYFVPCGTTLYVQVRTRSSATDTSDLKDTTKIFEYKFGGPKAALSFGVDCLAHFTYDGRESKDSSGVTNSSNLTFSWWFQPPEGVALSGTGLTGPDADGKYYSSLSHGTVDVAIPGSDAVTIAAGMTAIEAPNCTDTVPGLHSVTVYPVLTSAITKKTPNGTDMTVKLTGLAPTATALQWQINTGAGWTDIAGATNLTFTYSSFETDVVGVAKNLKVSVDGGVTTQAYVGTLWSVSLRLHADRSVNGTLCAADSDPVTLRKITGVDP